MVHIIDCWLILCICGWGRSLWKYLFWLNAHKQCKKVELRTENYKYQSFQSYSICWLYAVGGHNITTLLCIYLGQCRTENGSDKHFFSLKKCFCSGHSTININFSMLYVTHFTTRKCFLHLCHFYLEHEAPVRGNMLCRWRKFLTISVFNLTFLTKNKLAF